MALLLNAVNILFIGNTTFWSVLESVICNCHTTKIPLRVPALCLHMHIAVSVCLKSIVLKCVPQLHTPPIGGTSKSRQLVSKALPLLSLGHDETRLGHAT